MNEVDQLDQTETEVKKKSSRNPDREFDKTQLYADIAEERQIIHRDLLAHCLRWSFVAMWLRKGHRYKGCKLVDVGCGKEVPLAKMVYTNKLSVEHYFGVDINRLSVPEMLEGKKLPITLFGETNALNLTQESFGGPVNLITSFEVLEHMRPIHMVNLLKHLKTWLTAGGTFIVSTPCYDEHTGAAENHVNEVTHDALGAVFEATGWAIEDHFGTFASIRDYEDLLEPTYGPGMVKAFKRLREFHDTNIIANMWAPLFPARSRNCCWVLHPAGPDYKRQFKTLAEIKAELEGKTTQPWGQSSYWGDVPAEIVNGG